MESSPSMLRIIFEEYFWSYDFVRKIFLKYLVSLSLMLSFKEINVFSYVEFSYNSSVYNETIYTNFPFA